MTVDWTTEPDWDTCQLGGRLLPGIPSVTVSLPSGLDIQKPKGGKKASIRDDGDPPAEVQIQLILLPEDLPDFLALVPLLRARSKNGARDPLEIVHPNTAIWGINTVTIGQIESPMPEPGGKWVVTISAVEWAPAPVKVKKPKDKPRSEEDEAAWAEYRDEDGQLMSVAPSQSSAAEENLMSVEPLSTPL